MAVVERKFVDKSVVSVNRCELFSCEGDECRCVDLEALLMDKLGFVQGEIGFFIIFSRPW